MQTETRYLPATELRVVQDADRPRIRGYAIVFDSPSEVLTDYGFRFREVIKREAVAGPLAPGADVRALVDHDSSKLLARTKAGTLRYEITERGVKVEIDPPDTSYARDVLESIRRGDMDGMSFAFSVAKQGDAWDESGEIPVRTVNNIARISEFSVVTFPAYPDTAAAVRSLKEYKESQLSTVTVDAAAERIRKAMDALTAGPRNNRRA
jgi:uncharacterized protein